MSKQRILVIDDESLMREYVEEALLRAGHGVETASNGADGVAAFERDGHDLVVTDLKMTPLDGIGVLKKIIEINADTPIIVMTAYGTIETAVTALKAGAADYILKPFAPDALEVAVSRAIKAARLRRENRFLRAELDALFDHASMVGESRALQAVHEDIRKVADSPATVLVRGESGTGKELAARAIHHGGARRDAPFIKVNCAALSAGILESELFGHERGAFTGAHACKVGRFELADGGTLFLDEVSEIGVELQPKLLRALQEREFERVGGTRTIQVDTRIIATSNRDLESAIAEGLFREDLYYRLNVISLRMPTLRERKEDIPALMDYFLERYVRQNGRDIKGFTPAAVRRCQGYHWPGNVRELQNAVERAVVLSSGGMLDANAFLLEGVGPPQTRGGGLTPGTTVAEAERLLIFETLEHCNGNRTRASELLGISVRTLRNKLNEYKQEAG